ncbi:hsp90-like protein [Colletotrichum somersetense]|nr:hsp90-like protein [Colletotrichum somersetense]
MNKITEGAREWETFKYDSFHIPSAVFNSPDRPIPPSSLASSPDTGLTAFAQLGALRLNASRALISLFDRHNQYIVAEATRYMPLAPDTKYPTQNHLWLCGTAIPRAFGICEHVLIGATQDPPNPQRPSAPANESELPVAVVPDLAADRRFCDRPYIEAAPYNRFYAGVPIRSPKGINIGVYCIFDDRPRAGLDADSVQFLRDTSQTIMSYLEARRVNESYRRSERMVQGLGNFIEGRDDPVPPPKFDPRSATNGFEPRRLAVSLSETNSSSSEPPETADPVRPGISPISPEATGSPTKVDSSDSVETTATTATVATTTSSTAPPDPHLSETIKIFSRAANVIRKSLEVDGALFLDASVGSFGGLVTGPPRASEVADHNLSSSEDSLSERLEDDDDSWCKTFGRSSTAEGGGSGPEIPQLGPKTLRERFLRKLLRKYPNGKVFSFDEAGNWLAADYESDDADMTPTEEAEQLPTRDESKAAHSYFTKRNEAKTIIDIFPGARSIAIVPLWDPSKERCFAGGFVWSKSATRILTPAADLPFLRAFGMVTMSEVIRLDAILADRAKTDILGSLSHELRSPLHGVVAAAELLHDTQLDAFQVDVIHTIEISGKTLLDTIDHLLDYSKVNTFLRESKSRRKHSVVGRGLRPETSIESGMMSLVSDVHLDLLVEEVIESVFIGHSFHHMVASSLARHGTSSGPPTPAQEKLDAIATSDGLGHRRGPSESQPASLKDVKILVDIDPQSSWVFHTNPGAIRRVVMNLFGNALKYTSKGFIKIHLRQEEVVHKPSRSASMVVLTVTDSGKGISEEFLHNKLFTPFSQEDSLAPGTGLGLSLVRQIVTGLGGTISVRSQVGHGTSMTVSMPLVLSRKASGRGRKFSSDLKTLAGTRLSVRGFSRGLDDSEELRAGGLDLPVESLPFKWMDVKINQDSRSPEGSDLMVCSEEAFRKHGMSETGGVETPLVVVCGNAEAAQKLATSYRRSLRHDAVMEFIAQPTGPRKVAKALACALDRWKQRQPAARPISVSPRSDAFPPLAPSPRAVKSNTLTTRPRAQSETVRMVRVTSPPPDNPSQSPGDSWIANTNDSNTFTLTLPFRPAASAATSAKSTASAKGSTRTSVPPSPGMAKSPSEFLLVDDNAINIKILSAYMKRLQKRHTTASNGLEALQAYTSQPQRFCCILIDITMPVMDGLEATRRIRKFERAQNLTPVTVIAITSLGSQSARQEGFASGMDLFLTRPVTMKELVKILKLRKLVDETTEKEVLSQ